MNPIMSTKEAAKLLGIKTELVRRWCREGHIPAVQLGREYRISRAALVDWWEEKGGGRLDFESFYSVEKTDEVTEKDEQKADEVQKTDEKKADKVAKKAKKKTDEVTEKTDNKQRTVTRSIIR